MEPKKQMYDKAGPKVAEALKNRNFDAYYCSTAEEAVAKVLALIPKEHVVSWGGSATVASLGILDKIKQAGYSVIDRDTAKNMEEKVALSKKGMLADTYLLSSNAITQDGILLNLDGNGNRVAALTFGPDNVIVVAGMNKIVKTIEAGVDRVRGYAAPMNAQRFDIKTPCKTTGQCANCKSPDSVCATFVITRLSRPAKRIKVVLVGEDLGY
ncbi:MAG: lactate utilization protein [Spirochaetaceae bacterium]|nr:lactate utilization protein [Spirochaetaceae bacterium]